MSETILAGKVALVVGAAGGLGERFAKVLAEAGATVVLAGRRRDALEAVADKLNSSSHHAVVVPMDITRAEDIRKGLDLAEQSAGTIDILVNATGTNIRKPLVGFEPGDFDAIFSLNVKAAFLIAQAVAIRMMAKGIAGRIVHVGSILGEKPIKDLGLYSASKAALAMLTKSMALEWASRHINVNAIVSGYIETELTRGFLQSPRGATMLTGFERQRAGDPSDLDGLLLLLVSPASHFITGALMAADDGQQLTLR